MKLLTLVVFVRFYCLNENGTFKIKNVHIAIKVYCENMFGFLLFDSLLPSHVGTVRSPNHTNSWASLTKRLTSTSCRYFRLQP